MKPQLKKTKLQTTLSFILVVIITAVLFQMTDSGLMRYFNDMSYLKDEGVAISVLIFFKLLFMAGITFFLMTKNIYLRIAFYFFSFFTLWLSELNLIINKGTMNEGVIRVAFGDVSTRTYFWNTVSLFKHEAMQAATFVLVIIFIIGFIQSRLLPKIENWKAILPICLLCIGYFGTRGPGYLITEMPVPIKLPGMLYAVLHKELYYGPRDQVSFTPKTEGVGHLVFIVDESVRGDSLGINGFAKQTTPYLSSIAKNYFNYGIATSAANCSAPSNILLQTGVNETRIPDKESLILKTPTLFQYAKEAGYKTFYIPVRGAPGEYSDLMSRYDFEAIDEAIYIQNRYPTRPRIETDFLLEQEIVKIIKDHPNEKVFIYALKEGSHFLYKDAYPSSAAMFPDQTGNKLTDLRNSYYNSIVWVVDHFFKTLLHDLKDEKTTIVYTSDHGQGLGEDGDSSTHCKPTGPHQSQGNVPFLVFGTKEANHQLKKMVVPMLYKNFDNVSHFNIFPSLLVMMGYEESMVTTKYSKTIFQNLKNQKRVFLSGDLWGKVHKTPFIRKKSTSPITIHKIGAN